MRAERSLVRSFRDAKATVGFVAKTLNHRSMSALAWFRPLLCTFRTQLFQFRNRIVILWIELQGALVMLNQETALNGFLRLAAKSV